MNNIFLVGSIGFRNVHYVSKSSVAPFYSYKVSSPRSVLPVSFLVSFSFFWFDFRRFLVFFSWQNLDKIVFENLITVLDTTGKAQVRAPLIVSSISNILLWSGVSANEFDLNKSKCKINILNLILSFYVSYQKNIENTQKRTLLSFKQEIK